MSDHVPLEPRTIPLDDEEQVRKLLNGAVLQLWDVVNDLTRLRPTKRDFYRVTIFGSARAQPGTFVYEEVRRLAQSLTEMGCDIVTGGGPGLMQAANEGSAEADPDQKTRSIGIRVDLPFEQEVNPFVEQAFQHRTFFTRLHHFVLLSDAFVVCPGGIGTVLETMMIWQLLQVRHLYDTPLLLVGSMFRDLVDWARGHMVDTDWQMANPEDMDIPLCVPTADEAIAVLKVHHQKWLRENRGSSA